MKEETTAAEPWNFLSGLSLIVLVLILLAVYVTAKVRFNVDKKDSISNLFLISMGCLLSQGLPSNSYHCFGSLRILFFTTFMLSTLLLSLLSARLSSNLTVKKTEPKAENLEDVVELGLDMYINSKICIGLHTNKIATTPRKKLWSCSAIGGVHYVLHVYIYSPCRK